jgi:serine/threonine-protein kinase RsbW
MARGETASAADKDSRSGGIPPAVRDVLRISVCCDEFAPHVVREAIASVPDLGWVLGDAMLVASELVTNAVRHSLCGENELLTVSISRDGRLRISVLDPGGSGKEAKIADRPLDMGGLGLKVVEQLAASWGSERRVDGYRVWAELELPA